MAKSIERKLKLFEDAVRAHAWIGAAMPEDRPEIEAEYQLRKKQLLNALYMIIGAGK